MGTFTAGNIDLDEIMDLISLCYSVTGGNLLPPPAYGGYGLLAPVMNPDARAEHRKVVSRVFLVRLKAIPTYRKLTSSTYFERALKGFRKFARSPAFPKSEHVEYADAQFLGFVFHALLLYAIAEQNPNRKPFPNKQTIGSATKKIDGLLRLENEGLHSTKDWYELRENLKRFQSTLLAISPQLGKRARRTDGKANEREFIQSLAVMFLRWFGDPLRSVLINLATLFEYTVTPSVIDERIVEARAKFEETIVQDTSITRFSLYKSPG